jgi:hypothetical protein
VTVIPTSDDSRSTRQPPPSRFGRLNSVNATRATTMLLSTVKYDRNRITLVSDEGAAPVLGATWVPRIVMINWATNAAVAITAVTRCQTCAVRLVDLTGAA